MHILLVADGRSPITRSWLRMLSGLKYRVSLISTYPCESISGLEDQFTLPLAFASMSGSQVAAGGSRSQTWVRGWVARLRPLLLRVRALAAPLILGRFRAEYLRLLEQLKPDIVHALRIPFEGMLAAATPPGIPLILSIWGNDLTFHARTSFLMARQTRKALRRADGLLADAGRDLRLAQKWGLRAVVPALVLPGSGGLDLDEINRTITLHIEQPYRLPQERTLVVNPRGFRPGSVHQDVFFRCLPKVLAEFPQAYFVCTAMQNQPQAQKWVSEYHLENHVLLLPYLNQQQLWQLFSRSQVYVSLSSHDGTPNTFLEAMACGCFPVVGDIESLREWLENGRNGLLVDPRDADAAADAILRALRHPELRQRARQGNIQILKERAELNRVRAQAGEFYRSLMPLS
jgi:glycosyltransferase involved in cell wall biosynthesis